MWSRKAAFWILATVVLGCTRDAGAQGERDRASAPIRCYEYAANDANLERLEALRLCVGATSAAPAICSERAMETLDLSDLAAVRLCRGARSLGPVTCGQRLEGTGLEEAEIISYCAASRTAYIVPSTPGALSCVEAALDRVNLTEQQALRLCRGSESDAPVTCFDQGEDQTFLDENSLVRLCARVVPWPDTNLGYP